MTKTKTNAFLSASSFFLLVFSLLATPFAYSKERVIRLEAPLSSKDKRWIYYVELLDQVLSRGLHSEGKIRFEQAQLPMIQSRVMSEIEEENIDVIWGVTSADRERRLRPIRIPLLKGLLGHRIFIIKRETQTKLEDIRDLADLQQFKLGQGEHWIDTPILRSNGFRVVTSTSYEALFKMLKGGRFDLFPRSVYEAYTEVESRPELELVVEDTLLLKYVSPTFFFTNRNNTDLAEELEQGLNAMIDDGSFDEYFYNHRLTQPIFNQTNFHNRVVIELQNPYLTEQTASTIQDARLWFQPGSAN